MILCNFELPTGYKVFYPQWSGVPYLSLLFDHFASPGVYAESTQGAGLLAGLMREAWGSLAWGWGPACCSGRQCFVPRAPCRGPMGRWAGWEAPTQVH